MEEEDTTTSKPVKVSRVNWRQFSEFTRSSCLYYIRLVVVIVLVCACLFSVVRNSLTAGNSQPTASLLYNISRDLASEDVLLKTLVDALLRGPRLGGLQQDNTTNVFTSH